MKQLAVLSLAVSLLATGCVQESTSIGDALPNAEAIKVKLPEGNPDQESQVALGELSEFYVWTRGTTRGVNALAGGVLILVHAIVSMPPTTVDGNTYTWGPGSGALDPADYMLVVTDNLDGTYDWALSGKSKTDPAADFLVLVAGRAVEGADPHRGSGDFTIDGDAIHAVNPIDNPDARGSLAFVYDLENRDGTQATLDMHIDTTDELGNDVVADYHYAENEDRSGDFQFSLPIDVNEDGSAVEDLTLRSVWLETGAGRGEAVVTGGDAGDAEFRASQCWDESFRTVYGVAEMPDFLVSEGNEEDCAVDAIAPQ